MTLEESFQVLDLKAGASWEDVKRAYKLLASVLHPDRFPAGSERQRQADERIRRINAAYGQLREHYSATQSGAGEPEEPEAVPYIDGQIQYLGGDPRFRDMAKFEIGGRPAVVRVDRDGLTVVTFRDSEADEIVQYPRTLLISMYVDGEAWMAATARPAKTYWVPPSENPKEARIRTTDPAKIVPRIDIRLRFRNEYFRKLFQKQMILLHLPVDVADYQRKASGGSDSPAYAGDSHELENDFHAVGWAVGGICFLLVIFLFITIVSGL